MIPNLVESKFDRMKMAQQGGIPMSIVLLVVQQLGQKGTETKSPDTRDYDTTAEPAWSKGACRRKFYRFLVLSFC